MAGSSTRRRCLGIAAADYSSQPLLPGLHHSRVLFAARRRVFLEHDQARVAFLEAAATLFTEEEALFTVARTVRSPSSPLLAKLLLSAVFRGTKATQPFAISASNEPASNVQRESVHDEHQSRAPESRRHSRRSSI